MEIGMGNIFERGSLESKWILFKIRDRRYAIEAKIVKEILSMVSMNLSLVGGKGFFASFPLRDRLIYTFDLSYFWGEKPVPYQIEDSLLILENNLAIPIREVLEIRDLDLSQTHSDKREKGHLIRTEIVEEGEVVSILDTDTLIHLTIESEKNIEDGSISISSQDKLNWYELSTSHYTEEDKVILRRRKKANERLESPGESSSTISLAIVNSVDERFCIPLDDILEFSEPGQITPVPGSPSVLHGCMNLRGDVIPVLSLAQLMGKTRKYSFTQGKIIMVKDDNLPVGILVDELLDVVYKDTKDRIPNQATGKSEEVNEQGSFVECSYPDKDGNHLHQISLDILFSGAKSVMKS